MKREFVVTDETGQISYMTAAKHRERARDLLATHFATDGEEEDARIAEAVEALLGEIAAALAATEATAHAEGREEMREEAAKVADEAGEIQSDDLAMEQFAFDIAAAIRALPKDTGK